MTRGDAAVDGSVREDRKFVAGAGTFVADITPPRTVHVGLVTSPHAHARILGVDTAQALAAPGVVAVLTGPELAAKTGPLRQYLDLPGVEWRPLAVDTVRYAGEWVAAVVATSRALAEDAAELVDVDYEPLPAVLDPEAALRQDAPVVHLEHGSNKFTERHFVWGDVDGDFAAAHGAVKLRVRWNRNSTVPLETFGVVASWSAERSLLDVWASVQMPQFPEQIAQSLGVPLNQVRVHFDVDVGGSFGTKRGIKHAVLVGYLSLLLNRPVKFIEDRAENMHGGDFHGPDRIFDVEVGYTPDGIMTTMRMSVIDDEGAYAGRSPLQLAKPIGSLVGPYRIRSAAYDVYAVCTNKTGQVAVRGFGQSPTNYAIESAVDAIAERLGMDRIEIRRRNFIRSDEFPYRIPTGTSYDSGNYEGVVDQLLSVGKVEQLVRRRDELRAAGVLAGIGYATCLEPGGGNAIFENLMNPKSDKTTFPESCRLRVDGHGNITAIIALSSSGQGHDTLVARLVGREMECDPDDVAVIRADSLSGMPSQSPIGSRMAILLGAAVRGAADILKAKLVRIGAHNLGAEPEDVAYRDQQVSLVDDPSLSLGWDDLVGIAHRRYHLLPTGMEPGLEAVYVAQVPGGGKLADQQLVQMYPTFSFEAHMVLVTVDEGTGVTHIEDYTCAHDCGTVITPAIVNGMLYGGIAHGIGVALYERFAFTDDGQPLTQSFMDYLLPGAHEVPHITLTELCTPSPLTSLGQKGVGEAGYMGAPAAVASAVNDALSAVGGHLSSLPMAPSDVWSAIRSGQQLLAEEGTNR
jgi:2-furoyl-CoA dehydrogenase large subunit